MATFVLVHGAWHGGWCYSRVASRLRAQGHHVYTPTLSGLGERAHSASRSIINLSTHIQDIVAILEFDKLEDVILCGHSYGGAVITGVAGRVPERLRTLVYLDAIVPENGESVFDVVGTERTLFYLQLAGGTGTMIKPPSVEALGVVDPDDVEWVEKLLTPQPLSCLVEQLHFTGNEELITRRTFILAERHKSNNHSVYERLKDKPTWKTAVLDCGHDMMVDCPDTLTALLLGELERESQP